MFINFFRKSHNGFLLLTNFISGMSIMALEITAARLLAPYFGTSIFVWTNIIGVVLLALSCGYYFGGKYADRNPNLRALFIPMIISGIIFLIIPWLVKPLSNFITISTVTVDSSTLIIFVGSFLVTIMLFALPIFLLGMVSPFIIRLYKSKSSHLGSAAGNIFAISTIGSILGTFLPTLLLIPLFGSHITINIFATLLILLATFGLAGNSLKFLIIPLIVLPLVSINASALRSSENLLYESESSYQYIRVLEGSDHTRYLVFNEGGGIQSLYKPGSTLSGMYYDYFLPLISLPSNQSPKQVAIIGLAGGTLSHGINTFFGSTVHTDGVEIDKKVVEVAKKYFDLENDNLSIYTQDGHIFLKNTEKKYDLIVVDAYSNQMYIPWNMTTQEFWQDTKAALNDKGLIAINVNSTNDDSALLQAIANTMSSVYEYTYLARVETGGAWNYLIISSTSEIDFSSLPAYIRTPDLLPFASDLASDMKRFTHDSKKLILTADRAPVEMLTDAMIFDYIRENVSQPST